MKKKNSRCEFASERSECLLKNFRESIARQSKICLQRTLQEVVDAPAPRFWVSEARAMRVISMMLKGEDVLSGMHLSKQEMYKEIYRRVVEMKKRHPEMALGDIVFETVNSEAPNSYMTPQYSAKIMRAGGV